MAAAWKGNVRELDNALERAVILGDGPILTPDDFSARPDAGSRYRKRNHARQPSRGSSRVRAAPHSARAQGLRRR
ncbi:MAG: AAA-type ATPase lid domain-containing protein [Isosphaeraceae bacterium]